MRPWVMSHLRALGQRPRDDEHDESEHRPHQEGEPPADIGGERVQEDSEANEPRIAPAQ